MGIAIQLFPIVMAGANLSKFSSKTKSNATACKGHSLSLKSRKQTEDNDRSGSFSVNYEIW